MNATLSSSKALLAAVFIAFIGVIASLIASNNYLEEELGLAWLFKLRGTMPAPEDVVIVSIDKASAETLHLHGKPPEWPRSNYTSLIDRINQDSPALIALNIYFEREQDPAGDKLLAEAIARANNVFLGSYIRHNSIPQGGALKTLSYETIVESTEIINLAALGTAPLLIPKTDLKVKQFWTHKDSAGDIPTFPENVFQCYVFKRVYPEILDLLGKIDSARSLPLPNTFQELIGDHQLIENIERINHFLINNPALLADFKERLLNANYAAEKMRLLKAWLSELNAENSRYINHYGAVETITTIPFYNVLADETPPSGLFRNKIVLIGYSEDLEPEKAQGFYTVFSTEAGQTVSPIEIAGTAIANLMNDQWLKPLSYPHQVLLLFIWASLLSLICRLLPYRYAVSLIALLMIAYFAMIYHCFTTRYLWLPWIVPLLIQAPVVILIASHFRALQLRKERLHLQKNLGVLLPQDVINKMLAQTGAVVMHNYRELKHGVCLATDVSEYTKLAESLTPAKLDDLMTDYYAAIFPPVENHQGYITDLAGDGMYAVWSNSTPNALIRKNALYAALAIKDAITTFNKSNRHPLTTRLGLDCGQISIGHTGAQGRYVYRAVGDPVNSASRIEGLNKILGTQILLSEAVIEGLPEFLTRELGYFRLKGKTKQINIFELIGRADEVGRDAIKLWDAFQTALKLFQSYQWPEALILFNKIKANFPDDKPTQFFIDYINKHLSGLDAVGEDSEPVVIEIGNISL